MGPCFLIFNVPSVTTTRALSLNPRARSIWRPKTNSLLKSNQRRAKQTHHHQQQLIIDLEEERSVEGKGNSICKHAYIHDNWILSLLWTLSFLLVKKEERRNGKKYTKLNFMYQHITKSFANECVFIFSICICLFSLFFSVWAKSSFPLSIRLELVCTPPMEKLLKTCFQEAAKVHCRSTPNMTGSHIGVCMCMHIWTA